MNRQLKLQNPREPNNTHKNAPLLTTLYTDTMTELKNAWERFLQDKDEKSLLSAIKKFSQPLPEEFDYPYAHRIKDLCLNGEFYRVVRLADQFESIYIYVTITPALETDGVPYWLKGEKLQRWVQLAAAQDNDCESDAPTNWELFR